MQSLEKLVVRLYSYYCIQKANHTRELHLASLEKVGWLSLQKDYSVIYCWLQVLRGNILQQHFRPIQILLSVIMLLFFVCFSVFVVVLSCTNAYTANWKIISDWTTGNENILMPTVKHQSNSERLYKRHLWEIHLRLNTALARVLLHLRPHIYFVRQCIYERWRADQRS